MMGRETPDPQWDFTLAIRSALELRSCFEAEVDLRDAQAVVDLQWAARQAGRLLGAKVKVRLGEPVGEVDHIVAASVWLVDGGDRARAEEGLRRLRDSVQRVQGLAGGPRVGMPAPRRPLHPACDGAVREALERGRHEEAVSLSTGDAPARRLGPKSS